jgi:hypothetical protein
LIKPDDNSTNLISRFADIILPPYGLVASQGKEALDLSFFGRSGQFLLKDMISTEPLFNHQSGGKKVLG